MPDTAVTSMDIDAPPVTNFLDSDDDMDVPTTKVRRTGSGNTTSSPL